MKRQGSLPPSGIKKVTFSSNRTQCNVTYKKNCMTQSGPEIKVWTDFAILIYNTIFEILLFHSYIGYAEELKHKVN